MIKKVNVACGNNYIEKGWVNLDYSPLIRFRRFKALFWLLSKLRLISKDLYEFNFLKQKWSKKIIIKDVLKGLPFEDNSVDFLFCSHFIEHLTPQEAKSFIKECYRVLKPKGVMRILVPDFKLLFKTYLEKDSSFFDNKPSTDIELNFQVNHILYNTVAFEEEGQLSYLMKLYEKRNRHKWVYDFEYLNHLRQLAGFTSIKQCRMHEGECPDIKTLDQIKGSLFVELKK